MPTQGGIMKSFIIAMITAVSFGAFAAPTNNTVTSELNQVVVKALSAPGPIDWKVGDTANYKIDMAGGFISGTMVVAVKSITATDLVITQDMDLGFLGKQNCEATMDPNTGASKKLVCNGQEQNQGGDANDVEVVDMKEASVTVPAGTFQCVYIKAHIKSQDSDVEQWVNPKLVPVLGMIKTIAQSQMGPMTVELTSFKKN